MGFRPGASRPTAKPIWVFRGAGVESGVYRFGPGLRRKRSRMHLRGLLSPGRRRESSLVSESRIQGKESVCPGPILTSLDSRKDCSSVGLLTKTLG